MSCAVRIKKPRTNPWRRFETTDYPKKANGTVEQVCIALPVTSDSVHQHSSYFIINGFMYTFAGHWSDASMNRGDGYPLLYSTKSNQLNQLLILHHDAKH